MDSLVLTLGWLGVFSPLALGAMGSMLGVSRGGLAAAGAMLEVEGGYGRFVGVAAMPSSQTIYGIVVMFQLSAHGVTLASSPGMFVLGSLTGVALLLSGMAQGSACAAAINASKSKPEVFGISIAPAAVIEGFAVFVFVFALVLAPQIPT